MTIVEFLEARITEDERKAEAGGYHNGGGVFANDNYGCLLVQPSRILAECAAKRAIIKSLVSTAAAHSAETRIDQKLVLAGMDTGLRLALTSLTAPYSDHPDYREEWSSAT